MTDRPQVKAAVAAVTHDGLIPVELIPRRAARIELEAWPGVAQLDGHLREEVLAQFKVGPPQARYGEPFQPTPVGTCATCERAGWPSAISYTVTSGLASFAGLWLHDITPADFHPAQPATSPARPAHHRVR